MNCPVCKKSIPDDSEFCQFCGEKIEVNNVFRCPSCNNPLPLDSEFCQFCGHKISKNLPIQNANRKRKFSKQAVAILAISIVAVILAGLNIWQYSQISTLKSDIEKTEAELKHATDQWKICKYLYNQEKSKRFDLQSDLDFYHNCVVFCDTHTRYYHWSYDCSRFDSSSFYAFNEENAKARGYIECSYCGGLLKYIN